MCLLYPHCYSHRCATVKCASLPSLLLLWSAPVKCASFTLTATCTGVHLLNVPPYTRCYMHGVSVGACHLYGHTYPAIQTYAYMATGTGSCSVDVPGVHFGAWNIHKNVTTWLCIRGHAYIPMRPYIHVHRDGQLQQSIIQLETPVVGLARVGRQIMVACMNEVVHSYQVRLSILFSFGEARLHGVPNGLHVSLLLFFCFVPIDVMASHSRGGAQLPG